LLVTRRTKWYIVFVGTYVPGRRSLYVLLIRITSLVDLAMQALQLKHLKFLNAIETAVQLA